MQSYTLNIKACCIYVTLTLIILIHTYIIYNNISFKNLKINYAYYSVLICSITFLYFILIIFYLLSIKS